MKIFFCYCCWFVFKKKLFWLLTIVSNPETEFYVEPHNKIPWRTESLFIELFIRISTVRPFKVLFRTLQQNVVPGFISVTFDFRYTTIVQRVRYWEYCLLSVSMVRVDYPLCKGAPFEIEAILHLYRKLSVNINTLLWVYI